MSLPSWATVDPMMMGSTSHAGEETPYHVMNYCHGQWMKTTSGTTTTTSTTTTTTTVPIIHPVDRDAPPIFTIPNTTSNDIQPFIDSLRLIPKSGLHNPYKNPHRYVQYGEISRLVGVGGGILKFCLCHLFFFAHFLDIFLLIFVHFIYVLGRLVRH
jgi:1-pyrroline-5-carboxylate dehydrogenase